VSTRWLLVPIAAAAAALLLLLLDDGTPRIRARGSAPPKKGSARRGSEAALPVRNGVAIAGEGAEDAEAGAVPARSLWYGVAVDRRTMAGEAGASVRLEAHPSGQAWQGGFTVEGGRFVVHVPPDLPDDEDLRLVLETRDGRLGSCPVEPPAVAADDVGIVYLRSAETVHGRCVRKGQVPFGPVALELRPFDGLRLSRRGAVHADADDNGHFLFEGVPRGLYALIGRGPRGELFLEIPVVVPADAPLVVPMREAKPLHLTVRNTLGEPVAGARVAARLRGGAASIDPFGPHHALPAAAVETDAEGACATPPMLPGRYEVRVHAGGTRFDFDIRRSPATLVVPADPRVFLRFTRRERPLADTAVRIGAETYVTDAGGIAAVPRGAPPVLRILATEERLGLEGRAEIAHDEIAEGFVSATVDMVRVVEDHAETGPPPGAASMDRSARVVLRDGTPVKGAGILGGLELARTGTDGWTDAGPVPDTGALRLLRPDLASGHPSSGEIGSLSKYVFRWNPGRVVRVKLTDARFGFPVDADVRIGIQPEAWKRAAPGCFESRWDPAYEPDDARIRVAARGYAPVELAPPSAPGPPVIHELRLESAGVAPARTLVLRVWKSGRPVPAAVVEARHDGGPGAEEPGLDRAAALSMDGGLVIFRTLKPARFWITADAGWDGWGRQVATVGDGVAEVQLELSHPRTLTGRVVDGKGRPVEGAVAWTDSSKLVARTRGDGRFALNRVRRRTTIVHAKKPGHATAKAAWVRGGDGALRKRDVVLPRLARVACRLAWKDRGGGDPVPEDILCRAEGKGFADLSTWEDGRLVFHLPPKARVRLTQLAGSAVVRPAHYRLRDAIPLYRGAAIEGSVRGAGEGVLVFARAHERVMAARTDADGRFAFAAVPPGSVALETEGQTEESRRAHALLTAEDGAVLDVELVRSPDS